MSVTAEIAPAAIRRATLCRTVALEAEGLRALEAALAGPLGDLVLEAVDMLLARGGRLIVTGMGKSGHIGRKIAATLASTGTPSHFVHPAEASHGDLGMIRSEDAVLVLSWSGEAPELADIIAYTRRFDVPLIAMLAEAIVEMTSRRFGVAGVVDDDGKLIGLVTDGDLRRAFQRGFVNGPVVDAMTRDPVTATPDMLAAELLNAMNARTITTLFVLDGHRAPIGIVHMHDLLRAGVA